MRKAILVVMVLTLLSSLAYGQSRPASPLTINHAVTNVTNIAATGLDTDGNPGYIVLTGVATGSGITAANRPNYYLWIDETGDLCMASYPVLATYASFPTGNWGNNTMINSACTKVGGQS